MLEKSLFVLEDVTNKRKIPMEEDGSENEMVWYFIGVYIINRILHGRLEIRNFSSRVGKCNTRREISYLRAAM